MQWNQLDSSLKIEEVITGSQDTPILIFKYSSSCSISAMVLQRFERQWNYSVEKVVPYFLDLIKFRNVSNEVASKFSVVHESPQVLLIKNGECIFHTSHNAINAFEIGELLETTNA